MVSKYTTPKRKEEFVEAIHARCTVPSEDLRKHDMDRLKQIWKLLKPKKRVTPLPVGWKKFDVAALKHLYQTIVVPDLERENDGHWMRWNRPLLVTEIDMWDQEMAEALKDEPEDLYQEGPVCTSCAIPLVIRTNRLTKQDFFGCVRFPICRQTLPLTYNGRPTKQVQEELHAKTKEKTEETETGTSKSPYPKKQASTLGNRRGTASLAEVRGSSSDGSWVQAGRVPIETDSEVEEPKKLINTNVTAEELEMLKEIRRTKESDKR